MNIYRPCEKSTFRTDYKKEKNTHKTTTCIIYIYNVSICMVYYLPVARLVRRWDRSLNQSSSCFSLPLFLCSGGLERMFTARWYKPSRRRTSPAITYLLPVVSTDLVNVRILCLLDTYVRNENYNGLGKPIFWHRCRDTWLLLFNSLHLIWVYQHDRLMIKTNCGCFDLNVSTRWSSNPTKQNTSLYIVDCIDFL